MWPLAEAAAGGRDRNPEARVGCDWWRASQPWRSAGSAHLCQGGAEGLLALAAHPGDGLEKHLGVEVPTFLVDLHSYPALLTLRVLLPAGTARGGEGGRIVIPVSLPGRKPKTKVFPALQGVEWELYSQGSPDSLSSRNSGESPLKRWG